MKYRLKPSLWLLRAVFSLLGLAAVYLVVAAFAGVDQAPPALFVIFFLIVLGWNAYWWLLRIALDVTIDGDILEAKSVLRKRRIRLDDLVAVRPMRLASIITIIEVESGQPLMIMASKGIGAIARELGRLKPQLPVRLGWQARLEERLRGGPRNS